jgi:surfactin synthase thioesterase subunit
MERWSELTTGQFSCRYLPGGHFYLQEQRSTLVSIVTSVLESPGIN